MAPNSIGVVEGEAMLKIHSTNRSCISQINSQKGGSTTILATTYYLDLLNFSPPCI